MALPIAIAKTGRDDTSKTRFAYVNDWSIDGDCLLDRFARIYGRECMIEDLSSLAMEFVQFRQVFREERGEYSIF